MTQKQISTLKSEIVIRTRSYFFYKKTPESDDSGVVFIISKELFFKFF